MTVRQVPFFRPSIGEEEIQQVTECLRSGWLTTGPKTHAFEAAFAELFDEPVYTIAVNSATAALHLGLEALGIGSGDEVIVPTLTFTATAEVIRYLGAEPVFVDTDPETLCLSAEAAAEVITRNTKAMMPVHFGGRPCNMTALRQLGDQYGIKLLDDAAHALPARHGDRLIGEAGAAATAFSFYANKTMTTGEGGMLVTRSTEIAERAKKMRLHGIDRDVFARFTDTRASWIYDVVAPGFKYNMTDIAAAIGLVQLRRLDEFQARRAELAERYDAAFGDLPLQMAPRAAVGDTHSWHLYIIQLDEDAPVTRNDFIEALKAAGIGCSVHYRPLHQMTVWRDWCAGRSFPAADKYFERCVSLPLFMAMTEAEQSYVVDVIRDLLGR